MTDATQAPGSTLLSTRIPFAGFYESLWSHEIDSVERQDAEYAEERLNPEYYGPEDLPFRALANLPDNLEDKAKAMRGIVSDFYDDRYRHVDYNSVHKAVAMNYADHAVWWMADELGLLRRWTEPNSYGGVYHRAEVSFPWEFEELNSPREYNFTTDRVFVKLPAIVFYHMVNALPEGALAEAFEDLFTSRPGFSSFYDNAIPDKPLEEWDHNELYAIVRAFVQSKLPEHYGRLDDVLFEDMMETVSECVAEHTDWQAMEREAEEKVNDILTELGQDPAFVPHYRCPHTPDLFANVN